MSVTALPPRPPNPRVIAALEDLLARAKTGELHGFVAALALTENKDGTGRSDCSGGARAGRAQISGMIWSLERTKLRLMGFVEDCDIDLELGGL